MGIKSLDSEPIGNNEDRKKIQYLNICYFSHMISPKRWEMVMATSEQRRILKIRKPGEVLISCYRNASFFPNI